MVFDTSKQEGRSAFPVVLGAGQVIPGVWVVQLSLVTLSVCEECCVGGRSAVLGGRVGGGCCVGGEGSGLGAVLVGEG